MPLDLPTLFVVSTCITALLGLFLLYLWIQDRSVRALGWWAASYLIGGFAVALWTVAPVFAAGWLDQAAPALLFVCCGMIWSGARRFHGRSAMIPVSLLGAAIWTTGSFVPGVADWDDGRLILSSLIIASYGVLTAVELRRERRKAPLARKRALAVPVLHGAVFLSPILTMNVVGDVEGVARDSFPLFALLTLLYVVGTAFIAVVMAKERSVLLHRTAAMTDPLTGLFNRRGFQEAAARVMELQARNGETVTVLMFDLDHFKSINDRFGHDLGDEVLRTFAVTAGRNMRGDDVIGRLGGEEFAAILAGGLDQATLVAERVRLAFEVAAYTVGGHRVAATVSIGAAGAPAAGNGLADLIACADAALYRAKAGGRNRIAVASGALPAAAAPPLAPHDGAADRLADAVG